ncbi:hypothetical protein LACFE_CDS1706 [Limosilactobacillus fermentum]|uniref:Uncharacterized protein n=1 Tax=Limosilactobacillus fermentum TaxID=1613 RepID=A0A1D7ZZ85_LIMFE|nr:hypothetical protein LACFE_CDS1706 [Limosilactobacillus fermentum]
MGNAEYSAGQTPSLQRVTQPAHRWVLHHHPLAIPGRLIILFH